MLIGISLFFRDHQYIQATGKFATVNIDRFWNYVNRKIDTNWTSMLMHNNQLPNSNVTQLSLTRVLGIQNWSILKEFLREQQAFRRIKIVLFYVSTVRSIIIHFEPTFSATFANLHQPTILVFCKILHSLVKTQENTVKPSTLIHLFLHKSYFLKFSDFFHPKQYRNMCF